MNYQFYKTAGEVGLYGRRRSAPYTVDGQPAPLPPDTIEVEVVHQEYPTNLTPTQKATQTAGLVGNTYTFGWEVSDMTQEEIALRAPLVCNAQLKLWLINSGELDAVRAHVNGIANATQKLKAQTEFNSRGMIRRDNAMIEFVRTAMGWSHAYVNTMFQEAAVL